MKLHFGDFVLDREAGRLMGPEGEVRLRPQAFRMLEVLAEQAPKILSQEELLDQVWGVEHLSPASVKQAVSEVRQALGDHPARPVVIETVHRRGYRFIALIERIEQIEEAPPPVRNPELARPIVISPIPPAATVAPAKRRLRPRFAAVPILASLSALALVQHPLPEAQDPPVAPPATRTMSAGSAGFARTPAADPGGLCSADEARARPALCREPLAGPAGWRRPPFRHRPRIRLEEELAFQRQLKNDPGIAFALRGLARVLARQERTAEALASLEEALALTRKTGDAAGAAEILLALGDVTRKAGRLDRAREHYQQSFEEFQRLKQTANMVYPLLNLGGVDEEQRRFGAARARYNQALSLARKADNDFLEEKAREALAKLGA